MEERKGKKKSHNPIWNFLDFSRPRWIFGWNFEYPDESFHLLTLFGSVIRSVEPAVAVELDWVWFSECCGLCTSSGSFLFWFTFPSFCASFSSLILLWSDGVEGFEDDKVGATAAEISSLNIDRNCSSSNLSNSFLSPAAVDGGGGAAEARQSSSSIGISRNVMESLTDRRCDPRLAEEKSRNSSTQEGLFCWVTGGVVVVGAKVSMEGIFWRESSGQLEAIFGILGGNCAIAQPKTSKTKHTRMNKENWKKNKLNRGCWKQRGSYKRKGN